MGSIRARRWVSRSGAIAEPIAPQMPGPKVAVIGTGPAALACARALATAAQGEGSLCGARVSLCTSRGKFASQMGFKNQTLCQAGKPYHDYGCQYFTAKNPAFEAEVLRWLKLGLCQALREGSIGTLDSKRGFMAFSDRQCWVGNGGMSPMMSALISQAAMEFGDALDHISGFPTEEDKVQSLSKTASGWSLKTRKGDCLGPFDVVVGAFSQHCLTDPFLASGLEPCAAMLGCLRRVESNQIIVMQVIFDVALSTDFVAAHVIGDPDLAFVSNNSQKPQQSGKLGTPGPQHWTLLSTAEFAEQEFNRNPKGYRRSAETRMLGALAHLLGLHSIEEHRPRIQRINHWEDGLPVTTPPGSRGCLFDAQQQIGWCGDFCVAPCVEGAFLSGISMAREIAAYWSDPSSYDSGGLLPASEQQWPRIRAAADAAVVDIGAFPGMAGQLLSSCTHTDLVPSAVKDYQKDLAHFGAGGKGARRAGNQSPSRGKGQKKGKGGGGKGKSGGKSACGEHIAR